MKVLNSATSILAASNAILTDYERPANQSDAVKATRAGYGKTYYDKYAGSTATTTPVIEEKPKPATGKVTASAYAQGFQTALAGTYRTTAALNMRDNAGTSHKILTTLAKGTLVKNYGYFTSVNGVKWLYVQVTVNGVVYTGFCSSGYLQKV